MKPFATLFKTETHIVMVDGREQYSIQLWLKPKDIEQVQVMLQALTKFDKRNLGYNDLWQEGGIQDSAHHLKSKALRLMWSADPTSQGQLSDEDMKDDALDAINYASFFLRNLEAGRR